MGMAVRRGSTGGVTRFGLRGLGDLYNAYNGQTFVTVSVGTGPAVTMSSSEPGAGTLQTVGTVFRQANGQLWQLSAQGTLFQIDSVPAGSGSHPGESSTGSSSGTAGASVIVVPINYPVGTVYDVGGVKYIVIAPGIATPTSAAQSAPPPTVVQAKGTVQAGQSYAFQGRTVKILSVGSGGPSGVTTDNGSTIPIGSTWLITAGLGTGMTYTADAANSVVQVTTPPPASGSNGTQKTDLVEYISVDANGILTWRFDPGAPPPYEVAYAGPAGNWADVVPTPATQSGQVALNLPGGVVYTIVLHAGGIEVARTTYAPYADTQPDSIVGPVIPIPGATTGAMGNTSPSFFSNLFSSDASVEWIGGIPNWLTLIGGGLIGSAVLPKLLKKL